ncbi:hypothetical protein Pd630_LPD04431 [Rhodococcus opacus PD630]|uniref:hypothetical protein n=1 Tax=Rhodococcus opacus TaxID=37919 RepID=UPI00031F0D79|nr:MULTISPECIES: hypothetical protein [Rhodococcus]AHK31644.1 hypothetical protein Pd630_LPD04431 [Rhodococcus opacus PD630]UDG94185.1 DUF421 domain-containing protein [Rhodococcus opacus PD630]
MTGYPTCSVCAPSECRWTSNRRIAEIELAVLETNGRVSFFTRAGGAGEGAPEQPGIA